MIILLVMLFVLAFSITGWVAWLCAQTVSSADQVASVLAEVATHTLPNISTGLQAIADGNADLRPTSESAFPHDWQPAGMPNPIWSFDLLQGEMEHATIGLDNTRERLKLFYKGITEANSLLKSEIDSHEKAAKELGERLKQLEARSGESTNELDKVTRGLERELSEYKGTRETLQAWEQIFRNVECGIATIHPTNHTLLSVNSNFAEMHGYQPQELIGQSLERLVAPGVTPELFTHFENVNKVRSSKWESVHLRRNNTQFPVSVSSTNVTDANGVVLHHVASFQDISERKRVAHELKQAKEDAELAIRAKGQFLARMSHELRTPLNVILGFSQLLEMNLIDPEHHESVQHILKAGKHLLSLINEVLDISRIEADKVSLSLQVVPVGEVMISAMALVRPLAVQRNIEFFDQLNSRGVKHVIADNQRIQQVFQNLLSNAIKYNKTNGRVIVWCSERADNRLAVSVTDTGSGITNEKLPQLFTPFERFGAGQDGIEGTGLGLALSKRLVELMDGTLEVSSVPGEGSTFSVILPMASSPVQKLERLGDERLTSKEKSALPTTCQFLYIEQDMANLRLVEKLLKPYRKIGFLFAQNGQQGLDTARKTRPDMILLDLDLPDMPGEKVLQKLHNQPETAQIPVVVISADTMPRRIEQMLERGAIHYLTKPIDVNKLLVVIGESISIRENLTVV